MPAPLHLPRSHRLYTTGAYKFINDPFRHVRRDANGGVLQPPQLVEPHPLPVTLMLLDEALKRMRAGAVDPHGVRGGSSKAPAVPLRSPPRDQSLISERGTSPSMALVSFSDDADAPEGQACCALRRLWRCVAATARHLGSVSCQGLELWSFHDGLI